MKISLLILFVDFFSIAPAPSPLSIVENSNVNQRTKINGIAVKFSFFFFFITRKVSDKVYWIESIALFFPFRKRPQERPFKLFLLQYRILVI